MQNVRAQDTLILLFISAIETQLPFGGYMNFEKGRAALGPATNC
jgi:hypothetical protein